MYVYTNVLFQKKNALEKKCFRKQMFEISMCACVYVYMHGFLETERYDISICAYVYVYIKLILGYMCMCICIYTWRSRKRKI